MMMSKLGKAPIFSTDGFVIYMAFHAFPKFRGPKKATVFLIVVLRTEAYSVLSQASKIECFAKMIIIFVKYSTLDVCQCSEYVSAAHAYS